MMDTWTTIPIGSDLDRAEQRISVDDGSSEVDLGTLSGDPSTVIAGAAWPDRIDQAWITPLDLDDDRFDRPRPHRRLPL